MYSIAGSDNICKHDNVNVNVYRSPPIASDNLLLESAFEPAAHFPLDSG